MENLISKNLFSAAAISGLVLFLMAAPFVLGEAVTSTTQVSNAAPSVGALSGTDPITLSAGTTVVISCSSTVTDNNGYADVSTANGTVYKTGTAYGASDDNNNHYTNTSCVLTGGSGTTVTANCTFTVQYYADAAEWICNIYANDSAGASNNNSKTDMTVSSLLALDADNTIDFSSLAPSATSGSDVTNTVTNFGNVALDLNLSGANLTNTAASVRNISVGQVKFNLTDASQDYTANMTALSTTVQNFSYFSLAQRTSETSTSNTTTYWKISIPNDIQALTYNGTVTFTATTDA